MNSESIPSAAIEIRGALLDVNAFFKTCVKSISYLISDFIANICVSASILSFSSGVSDSIQLIY